MIPCPVCKRKKQTYTKVGSGPELEFCMRVTDAPEGGFIWYCYECDKAWDSIALLADVFHEGKIRDAIYELSRNPDFLIPQEILNEKIVEDYIMHYIAPRKQAAIWSEKARKRWAEHQDLQAILADNVGIKVHLLETEAAASGRSGRWMHATLCRELQEDLNFGVPTGLPEASFRSCLAIPWHNGPGRLSALLLLGWRKMVRLWYPEFTRQQKDPGIMLLGALPKRSVRIIAVSSPYLALWLQYKHFQEDNRTVPIVVWHEHTNPAIWSQLGAEEIIFWGYEPTAAIFKQALHASGDIKVSFLPKPEWEIAYEFHSIETYETWHRLRNDLNPAVPFNKHVTDLTNRMMYPYEACRDYLLSLDDEAVSEVLEIMKLEPDQIGRLLEACETFEMRAIMERLLERRAAEQQAHMFGGVVKQYIGPQEAYWSLTKRGGVEERLSDAVIELDRCIRDEEAHATFYTGVVHHRGKRYPFSATQKELRENTLGIAVEAVESAGDGMPFVSKTQGSKLYDLLSRFSHVEKTFPALTRVGWDKEYHAFLLPQFSIRSGIFKERSTHGMIGNVVPGLRVDLPAPINPDELDNWLEPNECNGAMWAVLTALIDNLLSLQNKGQPRGIGLVGPLAYYAADKICADLGLLNFNAERIRQQFVHFEKSQRDHDLPVMVRELESKNILPTNISQWMLNLSPKNVMMSLSPLQVATASLCGDWIVIETGEDDGDYYRAGSIAPILVHYLAYYQRQIGRVLNAKTSSHATMQGIKQWVTVTGKRDSTFVFNYAEEVIKDYGRESAAARLIYLVAKLLQDGYVKREYGSALQEHNSSAAIVIDSQNNRILISKQKLVEALSRRNLPLLDTTVMTNALREAGVLLGESGTDRAGWIIDATFWEQQIERWTRVYETYS